MFKNGDRVVFSTWATTNGAEELVYRTGTVTGTFYEPGDPIQGVNLMTDDGEPVGGIDSQDCVPEELFKQDDIIYSIKGEDRLSWQSKGKYIRGFGEMSTVFGKLRVLPKRLRVVGKTKHIDYVLAERGNILGDADSREWVYREIDPTAKWGFNFTNQITLIND